MLKIEGLSANYGRVEVLHSIGLDVGKGEIVALVGSNGAGKSTFLKTLAGVHRGVSYPAAGGIHLDGADVSRWSAPALVRAGLVLVPERRQVWPDISVADHLRLGAFHRRRDGAYVAEKEAYCLRTFPRLKERMKQAAGTLSGGEQQMLAMARALMANPRILLLDEPSTGLSPLLVERIFEVIQELRSQTGLTILLVEQMVTMTLAISDRAYVIDRGRIVLSGDADDLLHDPAIRSAYLGDEAG